MTDKVQKIKQEIKRRIVQAEEFAERAEGANDDSSKSSWYFVATQNKSLLQFIDSLQEEPANEDLEEEINHISKNEYFNFSDWKSIARHFAHWQHGKDFDDLLQSEMKFPKEYYERGKADMRDEMMKVLVNGEVVKDIHNQLSVKSEPLNNAFGDIKFGEKVKIIIVKPEQQ